MRLTGFAEVWTGTVVIVRASPEATYQRQDPYCWALIALVNPETGKAEIQGVSKDPIPINRETIDWTINQIRTAGYEPEWQRLRNGELKMGKTHDASRAVHAHEHQKRSGQAQPSGTIDQEAAGRTIDEMRALHKAGKTKIIFARTGEVVDDNGLQAYEVTLRAVVVSD